MSGTASHHHNSNSKRLLISTILIGIFAVIELIGGFYANSLALIADSWHMFADFVALFLSWLAIFYSTKSPNEKKSYGYKRAEIIAAFVNGLALFIISGLIVYEAIKRFFHNETVKWQLMLPLAILGVIINILIFFILHSAKDKNLNMKSAILHILGDILGFIAAIIAAIIIKYTNLMIADPLLSIIVAILILRNAYQITAKSLHILLEGSHTNEKEISQLLLQKYGILNLHHLHSWSLAENDRLITMHVISDGSYENHELLKKIKEELKKIGIFHSTIEIENGREKCSDQ